MAISSKIKKISSIAAIGAQFIPGAGPAAALIDAAVQTDGFRSPKSPGRPSSGINPFLAAEVSYDELKRMQNDGK